MRFFPRNKGKGLFFEGFPSRERPFSLYRVGKSHVAVGVENRVSLISVPTFQPFLSRRVPGLYKGRKTTCKVRGNLGLNGGDLSGVSGEILAVYFFFGPLPLKTLTSLNLGVFQRPLTLILPQQYRDTNGRRIVIQIGGVYTAFCEKEGILLQKYRDRNGRRIAILFKSIGVRGRCGPPDK